VDPVGIELKAIAPHWRGKVQAAAGRKHAGEFAGCIPRACRIEPITIPTKSYVLDNVKAGQR
jgi:hypothetical protein